MKEWRKKWAAIGLVILMLFTLLPVNYSTGMFEAGTSSEALKEVASESENDLSNEEQEESENQDVEEQMLSGENETVDENKNQEESETAKEDIPKETASDGEDDAIVEQTTKEIAESASNIQTENDGESKKARSIVDDGEETLDSKLDAGRYPLDVTDFTMTINGVTVSDSSQLEVANGDTVQITLDWLVRNSSDNRDPENVYYYNLVTKGISISDVENGNVLWNNNKVGTYSIKDGELTMQLTDKTFLNRSNLDGKVELDGAININDEDIDEDGKSTIQFAEKTYDVTMKNTPSSSSSLYVSKQKGNKYTDSEGNKTIQEFTIVVHSNGNNTDIQLNDIAGSGLSLVATTTVSIDPNKGTLTPNGTGFSYQVDSMEDGDEIKITYKMAIDEAQYGNTNWEEIKNKVTYTYKDSEGNDKTSDQWNPPSNYADISKPSINKGGSYDSGTGMVTWTVTIYGNDLKLDGAVIKDVIGDNLKQEMTDLSMTLKYSDDTTGTGSVTADALLGSGYTVPAAEGKTIKECTITYKTPVLDAAKTSLTDLTAKNDVTARIQGNDYIANGQVTIGKTNIIHKVCDGDVDEDGQKVLSWTTTIDIPKGGLNNLVYTDEIAQGHELVADSIVTNPAGYTATVSDSNNFSINFGDVANVTEGVTHITITYETKTNNITESLMNYVYNNNATISYTYDDTPGSQSTNANYTYEQTNILKKMNADNIWWYKEEAAKGELKWGFEVDLSGYTDSGAIGTLVITDTMPVGMKYKKDSLRAISTTGQLYDYSSFQTAAAAGITITSTGQETVTFDITDYARAMKAAGKDTLYIGYISTYQSFDKYLENSGKNVTNTAKITDNGSVKGSSSAQKNWEAPNNIISKTGLYDSTTAPFVEYTINVNPDGLYLVGEEAILTVTDTMGSALVLDPASIVLYQGDGVTKLSESQYSVRFDETTNTMEVDIPDGMHIYIKYNVQLDLPVGSTIPNDGSATNTVKISGFTSDKSTSSNTITGTVYKSKAWANSETGSITLYKYNQEISNVLEGATFCVEMVDDALNPILAESEGGPVSGYEGPQYITTGEDGTTVVDNLIYDHIYQITETKAPSGYAKNTEPYYFIIEGNEHKQMPVIPGKTINVIQTGRKVFRNNEPATNGYFNISKKETGTTQGELEGAVLALYKKEAGGYGETPVLTFTTGKTVTSITVVADGVTPDYTAKEIAAGSYKLVEVTAPAGYKKAGNIEFTVDIGGTLSAVTPSVPGTVSDDSLTLTMFDAPVEITIKKTKNTSGGAFLPGAVLNLKNSNGDVIKTIDTTTENPVVIRKLLPGTYTLQETTVPAGYNKAEDITFTIDENGNLSPGTVSGGSVIDETGNTVTMVDTIKETPMTISKQDINTSAEIPGAELSVLDSTGMNTLFSWTSGTTAKAVTIKLEAVNSNFELAPGNYILREETAPAGYTYSSDIAFTVTEDGKVKVNNQELEDNHLVMKDTPYSIYFSKRDMSDDTALTGAKFELKEKDTDTVVKTWISDGTDFEIPGAELKLLTDYVLTEIQEPSRVVGGNPLSYKMLEPVTFKINKDGEIVIVTGTGATAADRVGIELRVDKKPDTATDKNLLVLYNKVVIPGNFVISKRENGSTDEVQNVSFALYSESNPATPVLSWSTKSAPQAIWVYETAADIEATNIVNTAPPGSGDNRIVQGTYILKETSAPFGYERISECSFTVNVEATADSIGIVTFTNIDNPTVMSAVNNTTTGTIGSSAKNSQDLVVNNTMKTVTISKTAVGGGTEIAGATLEIFKWNETANKYETTGVKWTSEAGVSKVIRLDELSDSAGKFKLVEQRAPKGYAYAEDIEFSIDADGVIKDKNGNVISDNKITMQDADLALSIHKIGEGTDATGLSDATMQILKADGTVIIEGTTDASGNLSIYTTLLEAGQTYTLVEKTAPNGYTVVKKIQFTIEKDGTIALAPGTSSSIAELSGTTITVKDKPISLTIKKVNINKEALSGAKLKIVDSNNVDVIGEKTTDDTGKLAFTEAEIKSLKVNETYRLIETEAPSGYAKAQPITFEIKEDGTIVNESDVVYKDNTIIMTDEVKGIAFLKADETGRAIEGARLRVEAVDATEGFSPVEWVSSVTPYNIAATKFTNGHLYRLKELDAPKGYAYTTEDVVFIFNANNVQLYKIYTNADATSEQITLYDETLKLYISKTDIANSAELPGAQLKIVNTDNKNEVIESWRSTNVPHKVDYRKLKAGGKYTLIEETAPNGFAVTTSVDFTIERDGSVSTIGAPTNVIVNQYNGSTVDNQLRLVNDTLQLKIKKIDKASGQALSGAALQLIKKENDELIAEYVTDGTVIEVPFYELVGGTTYILREKTAPQGYAKAEDIEFTINADGKIVRDGRYVQDLTITMEDEEIGVLISKEDMGGKTLAGATLTITSEVDSEFVKKWVSSTTPFNIPVKEFKTNVLYTLTETIAPKGYACTESITFKIDENNSVWVKVNDEFIKVEDSTVTMKDAVLELLVKKLDEDSKKPVEGAKLSIIDEATGKEIYHFTSGTDTEMIPASVLSAGVDDEDKIYILRETEAPEGYKKAEDIRFAIDKMGNVYYLDSDDNKKDAAGNTLIMYDKYWAVAFSKTDISGTALPGATLTITSTKDLDFKPITWKSTDKPYNINRDMFKPNVKYVLSEIMAPDGYACAESIIFTIDDDGKVYINGSDVDTPTVTMVDEELKLYIAKKDKEDNKLLANAELTILNEASKKTIHSWTSGKTLEEIPARKLTVSTENKKVIYILREKKAPKGYELAKDIRFYIKSNGDVYIIDKDGNETLAKDDMVTMYDKKTSSSKKTTSKKTGDMKPIRVVTTLLLLSLAGLYGLLYLKKRKYNKQ